MNNVKEFEREFRKLDGLQQLAVFVELMNGLKEAIKW